MEVPLLGDCWIQTVMRRTHMEVTKDRARELKERKDALVLSGGELDTEGLDEDVQEPFRYEDDGTVETSMMFNGITFEV